MRIGLVMPGMENLLRVKYSSIHPSVCLSSPAKHEDNVMIVLALFLYPPKRLSKDNYISLIDLHFNCNSMFIIGSPEIRFRKRYCCHSGAGVPDGICI